MHQPTYKIVVTEKTRSPKSGKFIEQLGSYNPLTKEKQINAERIKYWISKGAQPSDTVHNLLVRNKIIEGVKVAMHNPARTPAPEPAVEQGQPEQPKAEAEAEKKNEEVKTD